jgi:hypothetical protein
MLEHAQQWQAMPPEQRSKARDGMHRFERMSPEQREQTRALFGKIRSMKPEERKALMEQWQKMTPDQRRDWAEKNPPPQDLQLPPR